MLFCKQSFFVKNFLLYLLYKYFILYLQRIIPVKGGYSLYTSLFNKKSFNKRVRYKQNLRDLITKNQ